MKPTISSQIKADEVKMKEIQIAIEKNRFAISPYPVDSRSFSSELYSEEEKHDSPMVDSKSIIQNMNLDELSEDDFISKFEKSYL